MPTWEGRRLRSLVENGNILKFACLQLKDAACSFNVTIVVMVTGMVKLSPILLAPVVLLATDSWAQSASEVKARLAGKTVAAWQCSLYAEKAGYTKEQERLFKLGYRITQEFVSAARKQEILEQDWKRHVPLIVIFNMAGPSEEFVVGRLYESISQMAFESITKKDASGLPLPPDKHVNDEQLVKLVAENRFSRGNCAMIE